MAHSRQQKDHVHQDYLARIRYSNALPPPPFYPKFLDIPNTGLTDGLYTSPHYASRLAREQPLNIEADAELGMHIDLVGIQGVFDGDETAILLEDDAPPLHPKDKELLRPLNALGKPVSSSNAVSFLRRTEYMSGNSVVNKAAAKNNVLRANTSAVRSKKKPEVDKNDPMNILRSITKSFDIAYPQDAYKGQDSEKGIRGAEISAQEKHAWTRPKHPTNAKLSLLDSYPVLPDLDALPDTGNYVLLKYATNPSDIATHYDPRLDVAIVAPLDQTAAELEEFNKKVALAQADPSRLKPLPEFRYEFFLPENNDSVSAIKRKFDVEDPQNNSEDLYDFTNPDSDRRAFKYKRLRTYETYHTSGDPEDPWNDTVAMALNDGEGGRLKKGAYLYPIVQRSSIRAVRQTKATLGAFAKSSQRLPDEEEEKVDIIELAIRDPTETELAASADHKAKWDAEGVTAEGGSETM